jgi:hypothetical protein
MCPACIAAAALFAVKVASTGGLATVFVKKASAKNGVSSPGIFRKYLRF